VNSQSDSDWAAFSSLQEVDTGYDSNFRPVTQSLISGSTTYALTQTSYDALGRVQCVATRMSPSYFGSLPSDACTLGTEQTLPDHGPDRIVKTTYDPAGQVTLVQTGYGVTGVQADEVATAYTNNGKTASVTDAEGNKTSYVYDGFDRLFQTLYPSSSKGAGTSNSADYEQLDYDANGNVTSFRNRANETISFTFDALDRVTYKDLPGTEPDVTYAYDLLGQMTSAASSAQTLSFTYDALGRNLTQVGPQGTVTSAWDIAGRRTRITHPDGFYVDQDYLVTGELAHIRENGATSGVGVLATYAYDDLGRRTSLTLGDGSSTSYGYDAASRLTSLGHDLSGTTYDQTLGFSYNPASEITQNTRSNDSYAWTGHYNVNRGYTANGLNQYAASGSVTPTYDGKGNLTSAGSTTYAYSSENLLTSASGGITLGYDPAMRLYQTAGGTAGATRFGYDGSDLIGEYNSSNALQRRFVHGPANDEPIVWYEGSGTTDRRFLHADERGSVTAIGSSSGTSVDTYDEYGIPRSSNTGRFQYTGQTWLPELGLYYYKARIYSPTLGRFLQTDPIGHGAGMNMYAYTRGDPVNWRDPSGLCASDEYLVVPAHTNLSGVADGPNSGTVTAPYFQCVSKDWFNNNFGFQGAIYGPAVYGSGDPAPPPAHNNRCGTPSLLPHGGGISGNLAAELGLARVAGASIQTSGGAGAFYSENKGFSLGAFRSGANVLVLGDRSYAQPQQRTTPQVMGGSISAGGALFVTNAQSAQQLSGPFTTYSLNVGFGPAKVSAQLSVGGGIWQLTLGPPGAGATLGASTSKVTTTTVATGGCH
jgi:RHS repeat-associated protein